MPNLTHIQPGDHVATGNSVSHYDAASEQITHNIYRVTKRTAAQAMAVHTEYSHLFIRIRVSDGKLVGKDYTYAKEATPDIMDKHKTQLMIKARWEGAKSKLSDLAGHPHFVMRKLSLEQLEALAEAWERIKAMAPTA